MSRLLAALNGEGEESRVVGGAIRNLLLGEPISDVDLATTALPKETIRRGRAAGFKAVPTGIAHGTVTLVGGGVSFEVTTLRQDVETDGRHAKVVFGRDFVIDATRRDFTINALGLDRDGRVHDYCGGLADLAERRVRFIGDAATRIREDYLRILRFFRFHARYGRRCPDAVGIAACIAGREGLAGLSRERVRAEVMKLLVAPGAAATLQAMAGAGLVMPVIGGVPHLSRFAAIAQDGGDSVYPAFRLAVLAVAVREDAIRLRERLRLSNEEFDRIERIALALEGLGGAPDMPGIAALRLLALRAGADAVAGAMVLLAGAERQGQVAALIAELGRTPAFQPGGRQVAALGVLPGARRRAHPGAGETVLDRSRLSGVCGRTDGVPAGRRGGGGRFERLPTTVQGRGQGDLHALSLRASAPVGGIEDRMESTLPPVFRPKIVPRS